MREERGLLFFGIAGLVVGLDQATKAWVRALLLPGQSLLEEWPIRLTYVTNTGGAFGLFPDQRLFLIVTAAIGVLAIFLYFRFPPAESSLLTLGLGLQLGGAVGNLADRIRLGHVTDFIDLRFWPVFNLADSSIVVGVTVLAFFLFLTGRQEDIPAQQAKE